MLATVLSTGEVSDAAEERLYMERLACAVVPQRGLTMADYIQMAQLADRQGYESLWVGEANGLEIFTFLGAILSHTTRLKVAPGIASIYTRTPALMALSAASLHFIAPQRTLLGLGVSTRIIVEDWHGLEWDHPLERVAEYVQMLRQCLRGERLGHQGRYYRSQNFRLGVAAPGDVPLYLAAVNTKMLRLAGAIADGVLLTWVPLEAVPQVVAEVRAGARAAGRQPDEVDIALYLRTCVTDDRAAAIEWLRRDITGYTIADVYSRVFRRFGFAAEVDAMHQAWRQGERQTAQQQISDRMVEALGVIGTAEVCREQIRQFAAAGIDLPIVMPFAPEPATAYLLRTVAAVHGTVAAPRVRGID
jgi:probable F420-dependent oxidoreductase